MVKALKRYSFDQFDKAYYLSNQFLLLFTFDNLLSKDPVPLRFDGGGGMRIRIMQKRLDE